MLVVAHYHSPFKSKAKQFYLFLVIFLSTKAIFFVRSLIFALIRQGSIIRVTLSVCIWLSTSHVILKMSNHIFTSIACLIADVSTMDLGVFSLFVGTNLVWPSIPNAQTITRKLESYSLGYSSDLYAKADLRGLRWATL